MTTTRTTDGGAHRAGPPAAAPATRRGAGAGPTRAAALGRRAARHLALLPALVVQLAAALRLQNSAFQDEALYLYYGHWQLEEWRGGTEVWTDPERWFTGAPQLYPVLAAVLDGVGGLELARLFSALCMLSATAAVYCAANALFARPGQVRVGAVAALVFAVSGPVLVLTRFATFDAPSYAAVAWALALGCRAARRGDAPGRWTGRRTAVAVGGLLALAVLLKYASAIDAPLVLLTVAAATWHDPARRLDGLRLAVVAGLTALAVLGVSVATWARPLLAGVVDVTVLRQSLAPETTSQLLGRVVDVAAPAIALGLLGGLLLLRRRPALGAVLLVASVAAPLYQVSTGESVSLHKTVVLGLLFGAPLAGYLLVTLVGRSPWTAPLAGAAVIWALLHGTAASERVYTSWPDTTELAAVLEPVAAADPGIRIAGETLEPLQHALREETEPWQWAATYEGLFRYEGLTDLPAFRQAVSDGWFGLVVLDGTSAIGGALQEELPSSGYERTDVVRSPDGSREWSVWQPAGAPG